jgi:hypothetical protein
MVVVSRVAIVEEPLLGGLQNVSPDSVFARHLNVAEFSGLPVNVQ